MIIMKNTAQNLTCNVDHSKISSMKASKAFSSDTSESKACKIMAPNT